MSPLLTLIRHAQAEHNLSTKNWRQIPDPPLTYDGIIQSEHLSSLLFAPSNSQPPTSLILTSPLHRALQTTLILSRSTLSSPKIPIVVTPLAQEVGNYPCDVSLSSLEIPRTISEIAREMGCGEIDLEGRVDCSLLRGAWNSKKGKWSPSPYAVDERAAALRQWLYECEATHVALVTHGEFLHHLTGDWEDWKGNSGTGWKNCEVRRYLFVDCESGNKPLLQEVEGERMISYGECEDHLERSS